MINKIIRILTLGMIKGKEKGFFKKLLDKNDPEVATSNFFIICVLGIGLLLLAVPIFILVIEAWFNHTISTDLSGMASYIMAVAAIFTSAGITKIGVHYTDNRFIDPLPPSNENNENYEENSNQVAETYGCKQRNNGD